ncbi:MAG: hypothetical protein HC924_15805 [Synechococcaceae cyanobacterium SM2_3_2]|nr:hypothetical protein [Synechococcaceae cyanobacterium SM2_3_2]
MMTKEKMLYSRTAASRILGVMPHHVQIQVWPRVVLAQVKGSRPRFLSLKAFHQDFVETRKTLALDLHCKLVTHHQYLVSNPENGHQHQVLLHDSGLHCNCDDYQNQKAFLKQACCKHCYAVLFASGYQNLHEYINAQQSKIGA